MHFSVKIPRTIRQLLAAAAGSALLAGATLAQSTARPSPAAVANDPDVLGAERLFSAWIDGQIAYRGLPGIAVGVVSDQNLVWAQGFGFADIANKVPMT